MFIFILANVGKTLRFLLTPLFQSFLYSPIEKCNPQPETEDLSPWLLLDLQELMPFVHHEIMLTTITKSLRPFCCQIQDIIGSSSFGP